MTGQRSLPILLYGLFLFAGILASASFTFFTVVGTINIWIAIFMLMFLLGVAIIPFAFEFLADSDEPLPRDPFQTVVIMIMIDTLLTIFVLGSI